MPFIPYGAYWATPFARWQGTLAHLNSVEFAAHVGRAELARMDLAPESFDFAAFGQTVIQKGSFFGGPWFTAMAGLEGLAAPMVSQACATGARLVATAVGECLQGTQQALIVSGDRCSNGPHVYFPAPHGPGGTGEAENVVLDNFGHDPWACNAMLQTGENVAAREGITTEEQHDLVAVRRGQYDDALADDRAFQRRYMPALDVPDARFRKTVARLETDEGVEPLDTEKLAKLKPVLRDGTITFAGQTHPADGNAGMVVVADRARAQEINAGPVVEILSVGQAREEKGFMPAAPIKAARSALECAGIGIEAVDAIKSHNPFAVNDIAFARAYGIDWRKMNNYGSSLIWGHPQGPTGLRAMIELIEELALRGGGTGLFQGCAAGDSAMAVVLRVG
ncbi:thiolase family protein [Gymnodinialimonas ceratoperidinii]|uniref:Thiolase family protein n=2 Tax=Gymnodinialimonas ceratoperidinii TaxID=2856823 RepID=A0A8F6TV74_9RHOB|nr:thiolase family protein [Gymnodinialimonas ceratoperidinii]QXT39582.1 thiolase family protein [Gymnodinialimonas ceratoperidinii]